MVVGLGWYVKLKIVVGAQVEERDLYWFEEGM